MSSRCREVGVKESSPEEFKEGFMDEVVRSTPCKQPGKGSERGNSLSRRGELA